ncbi:MAG: 50S ribosomal protein L11 methyltransferase [bacterium]
MPWLQAHLTVSEEQALLVEALFENLGSLAVTLVDAEDQPMLEPAPGETPIWNATRVTGLFSGDTSVDALRSALSQTLNNDLRGQIELEILDDQDWVRAWLDNFQPMRFGQRLWICPTGKQVNATDAVTVSLDPGLAFGTGTHPTTALCLAWLGQADLHDKTVIDYGCGSGVLGIAALKLGAKKVIAVDHDPQAILATRDNALRNQVSNQIEAVLSDDFAPQQADIVIANILANILVELAPQISPLVGPTGTLLLSGILEDQTESVISAYTNAMEFEAPAVQEGWVRLVATRNN